MYSTSYTPSIACIISCTGVEVKLKSGKHSLRRQLLKSNREKILAWIETVAVGMKKSQRTWYKTGRKKKTNPTIWWVDVEGEGNRVKNDA